MVTVAGTKLEFPAGVARTEMNPPGSHACSRRATSLPTGIVVVADIARVVGQNRDHAVVEDFRIIHDYKDVPSILAGLKQIRPPSNEVAAARVRKRLHGLPSVYSVLRQLAEKIIEVKCQRSAGRAVEGDRLVMQWCVPNGSSACG